MFETFAESCSMFILCYAFPICYRVLLTLLCRKIFCIPTDFIKNLSSKLILNFNIFYEKTFVKFDMSQLWRRRYVRKLSSGTQTTEINQEIPQLVENKGAHFLAHGVHISAHAQFVNTNITLFNCTKLDYKIPYN